MAFKAAGCRESVVYGKSDKTNTTSSRNQQTNMFAHTDYANYLNRMKVYYEGTIVIGQNNNALLLSGVIDI